MAQKIEIFNKDNTLNSKAKEIIFDVSINNRFADIKKYLDNRGIKFNIDELNKLTLLVEKAIYDQVFYLAHIVYYIMEKSNNWGEAGEQQVKISFCRNMLQKDPEIPLTQEDAFEFVNKVEENIEQLQISLLSLDAAKDKFKSYQFSLFSENFSTYKTVEINRILRFCGSDKFIQGGFYGDSKEFIFGQGTFNHKSGYDVIFLEKELCRTPNNIVSMAAIIGNREIYIRKESLKTIFSQKWLEIFNYNQDDKDNIKSNIFRNISEGIKQKTVKLFAANTQESLKKCSEQFISEMAETILLHEFGHGLVQHDILPVENAAIGEGTKIFGENIYTSMLEFLADFAPKIDDLNGPIQNMINVSKIDKIKATRMYFMYLSDTWFFDTDDAYMYIYSDLMALILLKYIDNNLEINFTQLQEDIAFNKEQKGSNDITMFERILELYKDDTTKIKEMAQNAEFTLLDQKLDYKKIRSLMIEQFKQNDGFVNTDSYEFLVPYWTNMLGYVEKISNSKAKLLDFIKKQEKTTLMKILILSAGRKKAEQYQYDHRKYIVDRMNELNLVYR